MAAYYYDILLYIGEVTDRTIHNFSYYSPRSKKDTRLFIVPSLFLSLFLFYSSLFSFALLSLFLSHICTHSCWYRFTLPIITIFVLLLLISFSLLCLTVFSRIDKIDRTLTAFHPFANFLLHSLLNYF